MHSEGAAGEDQGHGVLAVRLELAIQRHLRGSETGNVGWRQLVGSSDAELRTFGQVSWAVILLYQSVTGCGCPGEM